MSPPLSLDPLLAALPGAVLGLSLVLGVLAVSGLLLRRRGRRRAADALRLLGDARQSLEGASGLVTLRGKLELVGPPCASFERGAPAVAATATGASASVSSRADRIRLLVDGQPVELVGPLEVLVGSTETHAGPLDVLSASVRHRLADAAKPDAPPSGPLALRTLRPGDVVLAKGALTRGDRPTTSTHYREAPWTLSADPTVQLAFADGPRMRGRLLATLFGERRPFRLLAVAFTMTALFAVLSAGATAMYLRAGLAASLQPAPLKSAPSFGTRKECEDAVSRYSEALRRVQSCSTDNDCDVEMRGEVYFDLDGCFRFKNHKASTEEADRLAKDWLGANCVVQYEACTEVPRAQCREGMCVERPPPPIPEDWVRHQIAKQLSFFAPREWRSNEQMGLQCGPGAILFIGNEDVQMRFLYDQYDETDPDEGKPASATIELFHHKARLVRRALTEEERYGHATARAVIRVRFLDLLTCPPFCRGYSLPDRAHFLITAYCRDEQHCDTALQSIKTLRVW